MQDIFVGVMIAIAIIAGFWCWWYENHGNNTNSFSDESNDKTTHSKQ